MQYKVEYRNQSGVKKSFRVRALGESGARTAAKRKMNRSHKYQGANIVNVKKERR